MSAAFLTNPRGPCNRSGRFETSLQGHPHNWTGKHWAKPILDTITFVGILFSISFPLVCIFHPLSPPILSLFHLSRWGQPALPHCVRPRHSPRLRCRAVWAVQPPASRHFGPAGVPDPGGGSAPGGQGARARPWTRAWSGTVLHWGGTVAAALIGCGNICWL